MRRSLAAVCVLAVAAGGVEPLRISFTAAGEPLGTVLAAVAEQAGLRLDAPDALLQRTITLSLTRVTLEVALNQIARRARVELSVVDGTLQVREPSRSSQAPRDDLPADVVAAGEPLFRAALASGAVPERERFAAWLRAQRPDWRDRLPARLTADLLGAEPELEQMARVAELWLRTGVMTEAERYAGRLTRYEQNAADAWALYAEIELQTGDAGSAVQRARRSIELNPAHPTAAATLVSAIYYSGSEAEALAEAYSAATDRPDNPRILAAIGDLVRRRPEAAGEATTWLQRALALDPLCADALYAQAAVAAGVGEDTAEQWHDCLAAEGSSLRAGRARLAASAVLSTGLSDRGGTVWDISRDGQRVLYADPFRKQLQITDTSGFGLAVQVTDQETNKSWATLSPDEEQLAWVVTGRTSTILVQNAHASGAHREIAGSERGRAFRRTAWSPDSRYLVWTEIGGSEPPRLHCWSAETEELVEPPAPLGIVPGLCDVAWLDDGSLVGTVVDERRHAPVLVRGEAVYTLRPPSTGPAPVPAVDPELRRVVYRPSGGQLMLGAADGSYGSEVALLTGASGRDVEFGCWSPDADVFYTSLRGVYPVALHLAGLRPTHALLCRPEPLLTSGPSATKYQFLISGELDHASPGVLRAAIVADDGGEAWTDESEFELPPGGHAEVAIAPQVDAPGDHWLRVELTIDGAADEPRWYPFTVTR